MTELPNWFEQGGVSKFFERHLTELRMQEIHCLQIGAYKGDASVWLIQNVLLNPKSTLTDVDTWGGMDDVYHLQLDWNEVEIAYDAQTAKNVEKGQIIKIKSTSEAFFSTKPVKSRYDFIYVDGDHNAVPVLKDGLNAIESLNVGGILAFDDYTWGGSRSLSRRPKAGIDAILQCYGDWIEILEIGHQVWVKKTS